MKTDLAASALPQVIDDSPGGDENPLNNNYIKGALIRGVGVLVDVIADQVESLQVEAKKLD